MDKIDYGKAIERPFTNVKRLVIGILLSIIPIVSFITIGYFLNCARTAMKNDYTLPEWKEILNLFVKGILAIIIIMIYMLPALILFIIGIITLFVGGVTSLLTDPTQLIPSLLLSAPIFIVALILFIIAGYIGASALVNYSIDFKFKDAFKLKKVMKKAFTGKYFVVWILMLLYTIIISLIFGYVPMIGRAISGFIVGVTFYTAIGRIYPKL